MVPLKQSRPKYRTAMPTFTGPRQAFRRLSPNSQRAEQHETPTRSNQLPDNPRALQAPFRSYAGAARVTGVRRQSRNSQETSNSATGKMGRIDPSSFRLLVVI